MKVIAVDFDGCLCTDRYPEIGDPREQVIERIKRRKYEGDKVILWTCRTGPELYDAVSWCANYGLYFDAVNANLPERIAKYKEDCRKVSADEYWDDKAVRV